MTIQFPFVALCGYPGSGKSTVQKMLKSLWDIIPADDARLLRDIAMITYDLSEWHVSSQEGKASLVDVNGDLMPVRSLIEGIGNDIIRRHGTQFKPRRAMQVALKQSKPPHPRFSFGSVRLDEAIAYRSAGGLCIEIVRPGCAPTGPADAYDRAQVDVTIANAGSLGALEVAVINALEPCFGPPAHTSSGDIS